MTSNINLTRSRPSLYLQGSQAKLHNRLSNISTNRSALALQKRPIQLSGISTISNTPIMRADCLSPLLPADSSINSTTSTYISNATNSSSTSTGSNFSIVDFVHNLISRGSHHDDTAPVNTPSTNAVHTPVDAPTYPPGVEAALQKQKSVLNQLINELKQWDTQAQKHFENSFGTTTEEDRKHILIALEKMLELNKTFGPQNFAQGDPSGFKNLDEFNKTFAYVYPGDKKHIIYLCPAFDRAPATGTDSKFGTLCHEMSHFKDVLGTEDHIYGPRNCISLAETDPEIAKNNADNFELYCETLKSLKKT